MSAIKSPVSYTHLKLAEQRASIHDYTVLAKEFCHRLAEKDLQFLPPLGVEELEQILKMQGIRRYLLNNSLDRACLLYTSCSGKSGSEKYGNGWG